ncbi:MAG: lipid II flippase MurJ [Cyanobacteria bacterium P01_C01_bin.38]
MKNLRCFNLFAFWRKLTSGSTNRKIFGAALTVGLGTALVKIAAMAKELVVAWRFGTQDELDAFYIALLVPSFVINVIAGSFNSAFVPTYIQVLQKQGVKAAQKLFSSATLSNIGLLVIAGIFIVITAPVYLQLIGSGFSSQKLGLTFNLLLVIAPLIMLSGIMEIWGAVFNAREHFALFALVPIITPIVSFILLLGLESWGIFALAAAISCGALIELAILGVGLHKQGISLYPKWYGFDSNLRQVSKQYAPMIAGSLMICSASTIDQLMVAMLSPGSVAALNYGNRLIASPISLMTIALGTAVIPYFSKMVASRDWKGVSHTLKRYLLIIFLITVPLAIIMFVFSQPIVKIFFQRGSFTSEDTFLVSQIQAFYALQIPFYIANILVVKLISSMQQNHLLMWVSGLNLIVNILGNYVFIQWLGVKGIALSTSCVYLFSFIYLFIAANKQLERYQNI